MRVPAGKSRVSTPLLIEWPTAMVTGSAHVPVPPALWCRTGLEMTVDPGGVLSQYPYPVV
jgi:hypothetical protein